MQTVNGALGATHLDSDLTGCQPAHMAHEHDVALLVGQRGQRLVQCDRTISCVLVRTRVGAVDLLRGDGSARTQEVDRRVMREPQKPTEERTLRWSYFTRTVISFEKTC